jgi:flagellar biosynthesis/type III secretory pathway protein FliH
VADDRSWMSIAVTVVALGIGAQWAVSQTQFSNVDKTETADRAQALAYYNANKEELARREAELKSDLEQIRRDYLSKDEHRAYLEGTREQLESFRARLSVLETELLTLVPKLAHDPVEQKTIDAINTAMAKQIDQIQAEITDINRQIAAALIIIDNNAGAMRKSAPTLPP